MSRKRFYRNYITPPHPAAFSGLSNLKRIYPSRSLAYLRKELESIDAYTKHKQSRRGKASNPFIIRSKLSLLQIDLLDVRQLAAQNDNVKYIFMIIDTFSRKAWGIPLQNKKAIGTTRSFKHFLEITLNENERGKVERVLSDRGREFNNKKFKDLLAKKGIKLIHPNLHAPHVERLNRTIQRIMYSFMTEKKGKRYIGVLPQIFQSYNNRIHSAHDLSPNAAFLPRNESKTKYILSYKQQKREEAPKKATLKVGDFVRVEKPRKVFSRSYKPTHSREMFIISKVIEDMARPMYVLEDLKGSIISSRFYEHQLAKIRPNDSMFDIEKVVKRNKNQLFVKWKGYPAKFNTWISYGEKKRLKP